MKRFIALLLALVLLVSLSSCKKKYEPLKPYNPVTPDNEYNSDAEENSLPKYDNKPYVKLNNNIPYFTDEDKKIRESFEYYDELDRLGRCSYAVASVSKDLMPTEKRGNIGSVKPTAWQISKYDFVDGKYLYNRCHLIGYQLSGENANEKNLITGTRYMNVQGMLPFENMVADYVNETENHVLYRVTPVFENDELLARGVIMEGYSLEDNGEGICFCVFAFNVQPGVEINYADGSNKEVKQENVSEYVLNTGSKKFHRPDCESVKTIKSENKQTCKANRELLISEGYIPCKSCNP